MKEQDTIEINVIQLLKALWAKKLLILLVAIVTGAAAFAYSSFVVKPEYRSTTRIYVVKPRSETTFSRTSWERMISR